MMTKIAGVKAISLEQFKTIKPSQWNKLQLLDSLVLFIRKEDYYIEERTYKIA